MLPKNVITSPIILHDLFFLKLGLLIVLIAPPSLWFFYVKRWICLDRPTGNLSFCNCHAKFKIILEGIGVRYKVLLI